jgi:hypothetical protein
MLHLSNQFMSKRLCVEFTQRIPLDVWRLIILFIRERDILPLLFISKPIQYFVVEYYSTKDRFYNISRLSKYEDQFVAFLKLFHSYNIKLPYNNYQTILMLY